jgi:hypothetical protein
MAAVHSKRTALSTFLTFNRGWWKPGEERTHLLLTNGCLSIKKTNNSEFLDAYSTDICNGIKTWCISEQRTDVYKMHLDMDYVTHIKDDGLMLDATEYDTLPLSHIVTAVQAISSEYDDVPNETFECIITSSPVKKTQTCNKLGVHVIFKRLFVTSEIGLALVSCVRNALLTKFGQRDCLHNCWEEVVDEATHCTAGLRMVYSDRPTKDKTEFQNRPHTPKFTVILEEPVIIKPWRETISRAIHYTSIRTWQSITPGFKLKYSGVIIKKPNKSIVENKRVKTTACRSSSSSPEVLLLESRIRKNSAYKAIHIRKISNCDDIKFINVDGDGSHFCGNVGREHGSTSIYFLLCGNKLYQRCYSKKYGCKTYEHELID